MHVKIKHLDIFELCVEVPAVESHPIARVHRSEQLTTLPLCVTSYLDLTRNVHESCLVKYHAVESKQEHNFEFVSNL